MSGQPVAAALAVDVTVRDPAERLTTLFDDHHDRLYRLARRLALNAEDAHDLVQETFLRAARSARSVPTGPANEEAWLVRVLINIRRDQWRMAAVRTRSKAILSAGVATADSGQEAALIARATIWQALDALPPRRRAIVIMHELEDMAIPAIASLLGITAITVRWHLSKGRRELTRVLQPFMGETR